MCFIKNDELCEIYPLSSESEMLFKSKIQRISLYQTTCKDYKQIFSY